MKQYEEWIKHLWVIPNKKTKKQGQHAPIQPNETYHRLTYAITCKTSFTLHIHPVDNKFYLSDW